MSGRTSYRRRHSLFAMAFLAVVLNVSSLVTAEDATLYFFTSDGCPPCRQVEPMLEALTHQGLSITKVDVNAYPAWVQKYKIQATPTLVLVKDNREMFRHSGLIDQSTVKQWFAQANAQSSPTPPPAVVLPAARTRPPAISPPSASKGAPHSPTLHQGTRTPANNIEKIAMNATVRLRVEDPEGFSYATGTVIHSHEGEWLVLTCGHVFRDSGGKGTITAEYDFADNRPRTVTAKLISYDAEARDVALVAVQANASIQPVELATLSASVDAGHDVFSIGCDHGENPTIRRTKIKNQAKYDGVKKYEIFGRPVVGRSGGGLFNAQGQLVGVCNAAAVDYDEGIYSSLSNIHHQIATVDLQHLFGAAPMQIAQNNGPNGVQSSSPTLPTWETVPGTANSGDGLAITAGTWDSNSPPSYNKVGGNPASIPPVNSLQLIENDRPFATTLGAFTTDDMEVTVLVRSRSNPAMTESITLPSPSPELLEYLKMVAAQRAERRATTVADLRNGMPVTPPPQDSATYRAQSPR